MPDCLPVRLHSSVRDRWQRPTFLRMSQEASGQFSTTENERFCSAWFSCSYLLSAPAGLLLTTFSPRGNRPNEPERDSSHRVHSSGTAISPQSVGGRPRLHSNCCAMLGDHLTASPLPSLPISVRHLRPLELLKGAEVDGDGRGERYDDWYGCGCSGCTEMVMT